MLNVHYILFFKLSPTYFHYFTLSHSYFFPLLLTISHFFSPSLTYFHLFSLFLHFHVLGMMTGTSHFMAPTIPEALFCAYQLAFAIITAGLICGSFADRMKYHSMIIFITFWHLVVYCPLAHSNWHPQGWLYRLGKMTILYFILPF